MVNLFLALDGRFLLTSDETLKYVIIGAAAVCVIAAAFVIAYFSLRRKMRRERQEGDKVEKVKIIDGVRYTESQKVIKNSGMAKVSHLKGDVILERGKEYIVKKGGEVMPGKYTVLTSDEGVTSFNIRQGGFVREYSHNSSIVLAEGDLITSVSHTVVLR